MGIWGANGCTEVSGHNFRVALILSNSLNRKRAAGKGKKSLLETWSQLGCLSQGQGRHHGLTVVGRNTASTQPWALVQAGPSSSDVHVCIHGHVLSPEHMVLGAHGVGSHQAGSS